MAAAAGAVPDRKLAIMLMIVGATLLVLFTIERNLLLEHGLEINGEFGNSVQAKLQRRLSLAESLTRSIANSVEALPKDAAILKELVPNLPRL